MWSERRDGVESRRERNVDRGRKGEMVLMVGEKEMLFVVERRDGVDGWRERNVVGGRKGEMLWMVGPRKVAP